MCKAVFGKQHHAAFCMLNAVLRTKCDAAFCTRILQSSTVQPVLYSGKRELTSDYHFSMTKHNREQLATLCLEDRSISSAILVSRSGSDQHAAGLVTMWTGAVCTSFDLTLAEEHPPNILLCSPQSASTLSLCHCGNACK